jgi:prepilin-type processing-associated H-X9-DG protein
MLIGANVATPGGAPVTNATLQSRLPIYICPADNAQPFNTLFQSYGFSNYVVNREVCGPNASSRPATLSVQGILDGSSNTILVGEHDYSWNTAAVWGVRSSISSSCFEGRPGPGICPRPPEGTAWDTLSAERMAFSSQHTGGCNFLFADGSIHFVTTSVQADPNDSWTNFPANQTNYTLQNLFNPADGNTVNFLDQ